MNLTDAQEKITYAHLRPGNGLLFVSDYGIRVIVEGGILLSKMESGACAGAGVSLARAPALSD